MAVTKKTSTGMYLAADVVGLLDAAATRTGLTRAKVVESLARLYAPSLTLSAEPGKTGPKKISKKISNVA